MESRACAGCAPRAILAHARPPDCSHPPPPPIMSTEPEQSFANHARMVPGFHYVTFGLAFVFLVGSIWFAVSTRTAAAHIQMVGAFMWILFLARWRPALSRSQPKRVQG